MKGGKQPVVSVLPTPTTISIHQVRSWFQAVVNGYVLHWWSQMSVSWAGGICLSGRRLWGSKAVKCHMGSVIP